MAGVCGMFCRLIFLSLVFTITFVALDIRKHGSLESSTTGRALKDAGLLIYVKPYYAMLEKRLEEFRRWADKSETVRSLQVTLYRSVVLTKHYIETGAAYVYKKAKDFSNTVASSLPENVIETAKKITSDVVYFILYAFSICISYIHNAFQVLVQWLEKNGFYEKSWMDVMTESGAKMVDQIPVVFEQTVQFITKRLHCVYNCLFGTTEL